MAVPRAAFRSRLRTERLHELVEILAAEELVAFPEDLARHGDRPDVTSDERERERERQRYRRDVGRYCRKITAHLLVDRRGYEN